MCCQHCDRVDEMGGKIEDLRVESATIAGNVKNLVDSSVRIEEGMVTQHEFRPVRAVVYAMVSGLGALFLGSLAAHFVWK